MKSENTRIIAITGSIGSGKSTALQWFRNKGHDVVSTDEIGHELLKKPEVISQIIYAFGNEVMENGKIDRKKLGSIVFAHPEQLDKLNQILHPRIIKVIKERIAACDSKLLIFEVPLLFEAGIEDLFDLTINIAAREEIRKKRILERDGLNENDINQRFRNQMPDEIKRKKASITIDNNGDKNSLLLALERIYSDLIT